MVVSVYERRNNATAVDHVVVPIMVAAAAEGYIIDWWAEGWKRKVALTRAIDCQCSGMEVRRAQLRRQRQQQVILLSLRRGGGGGGCLRFATPVARSRARTAPRAAISGTLRRSQQFFAPRPAPSPFGEDFPIVARVLFCVRFIRQLFAHRTGRAHFAVDFSHGTRTRAHAHGTLRDII